MLVAVAIAVAEVKLTEHESWAVGTLKITAWANQEVECVVQMALVLGAYPVTLDC